MKILTLDEAFKDGHADLIEDALDQFNDRRIVDARIFSEVKSRLANPEAIRNFLRINNQKGFSRFKTEPSKITFQ